MKFNKKFCLIIVLFLLSFSLYDGHAAVFEKGDAIYYEGKMIITAIWGHCGLFYGWPFYGYWDPVPDPEMIIPVLSEEANTQDASQYATVESLGGDSPFVAKSNIGSFLSRGAAFWGVHTADLSYLQRNQITETAKNQMGCKYRFLWDYKDPGVSFRCDGLVEYCYEQAGVDLVPGDTWFPLIALFPGRNLLTPLTQKNSPLFSERTSAEVETVELANVLQNGETVEPDSDIYYVHDIPNHQDTVTIEVNVSDGGNGSGIRMTDFWVGEPDDTPDTFEGNNSGKRIGIDAHEERIGGIYKADWNIDEKNQSSNPIFPSGEYTINVLAYDQAGNMKNISIEIWKNPQPSPTSGGFWKNSSGELREANYSSTTGLIYDAETGIPFDTAPWTFGGTPIPLYPYCGSFNYESGGSPGKFWNGSNWVDIPAFPYEWEPELPWWNGGYRHNDGNNIFNYPHTTKPPCRTADYCDFGHVYNGYSYSRYYRQKIAYLDDNNSWQESVFNTTFYWQTGYAKEISMRFENGQFFYLYTTDYYWTSWPPTDGNKCRYIVFLNGNLIDSGMETPNYVPLSAFKDFSYWVRNSSERRFWKIDESGIAFKSPLSASISGSYLSFKEDNKIVLKNGSIYHYFDGSSWHYNLRYLDLSELYGKLCFNGTIWTFF